MVRNQLESAHLSCARVCVLTTRQAAVLGCNYLIAGMYYVVILALVWLYCTWVLCKQAIV